MTTTMKQIQIETYLPNGVIQTLDGVEWENRQDAVWYHGYGEVARVTARTEDGETYAVSIRCDGETKVVLPDGFPLTYVRYADEWETIGVNTDTEMMNFTQKMLDEHGHDIWIHNSWFDIYAEIDGRLEHLDAVTHDITEAHNQARAILQEVVALGGWGAYSDEYQIQRPNLSKLQNCSLPKNTKLKFFQNYKTEIFYSTLLTSNKNDLQMSGYSGTIRPNTNKGEKWNTK